MLTKKLFFAILCGLLAVGLTTSVWAQAQATVEKAPPVAASEKKVEPAPAAPEKKVGAPKDPKKHTSLGLYVTAKEAYEMWQKGKDKVKILDVRTPEEYAVVGHPAMAVNIPVQFITYRWNPEKKDYIWKDNPKFVQEVKKMFKPTDTLLVMCRSGHRGAVAVEKLAKAGFKNVYNIHDGFEGDKVTDKNDPNYGKRTKDGWKNSGLPWTYDLNPDFIYLPYGKPKN